MSEREIDDEYTTLYKILDEYTSSEKYRERVREAGSIQALTSRCNKIGRDSDTETRKMIKATNEKLQFRDLDVMTTP